MNLRTPLSFPLRPPFPRLIVRNTRSFAKYAESRCKTIRFTIFSFETSIFFFCEKKQKGEREREKKKREQRVRRKMEKLMKKRKKERERGNIYAGRREISIFESSVLFQFHGVPLLKYLLASFLPLCRFFFTIRKFRMENCRQSSFLRRLKQLNRRVYCWITSIRGFEEWLKKPLSAIPRIPFHFSIDLFIRDYYFFFSSFFLFFFFRSNRTQKNSLSIFPAGIHRGEMEIVYHAPVNGGCGRL